VSVFENEEGKTVSDSIVTDIPLNPDPSPINDPDTVPITSKDPEITADPVNGNGDIYPSRYDAVRANEEDTEF